ncbi:hypothetical protein ILUMI_19042, partial [Ignelater luminosus]
YGRTCQDIGCPSNEVCVMQEDPCSRNKRADCGTYPTCKRVSNALPTCATYACPPTQVCRIDGGQPKCFHSAGSGKHKRHIQSYNTDYTSSTVSSSSGSYYQGGQTLSRPNVYPQGQSTSGSYYQ